MESKPKTAKFDKYADCKLLDWTVDRFDPDHIKEMEKYNKYLECDRQRHWNNLSTNYEALYQKAGYPDPEKVAEHVAF